MSELATDENGETVSHELLKERFEKRRDNKLELHKILTANPDWFMIVMTRGNEPLSTGMSVHWMRPQLAICRAQDYHEADWAHYLPFLFRHKNEALEHALNLSVEFGYPLDETREQDGVFPYRGFGL